MKVYCVACGCHFPNDFETTLKPPCNFWGDAGMSNLPAEYKKKVWDWAFSLPVDEIGIKFKLGIGFNFMAAPIDEDGTFEKNVPGWNKMSEKERQDYERKYFKMKNKGQPPTVKKKEEFPN